MQTRINYRVDKQQEVKDLEGCDKKTNQNNPSKTKKSL